jgi:beta-lactamase superfamily II metal-dependent hydrolase
MKYIKVMKHMSTSLIFALAIIVCATALPLGIPGIACDSRVYAANDNVTMQIHAIYLGKKKTESENGDAVLIESDGKFLLMDTGRKDSASIVNRYLNKNMKKVKSLDLYISHIHSDHYGAYATIFKNYNVGTVYLYDGYGLSNGQKGRINELIGKFKIEKDKKNANNKKNNIGLEKELIIKYLNYVPGTAPVNTEAKSINSFKVGKADVTIIGAIYSENFDSANRANNMSLIAQIKGGGMTYLSCGDIQVNSKKDNKLGGEEILLANSKKASLKADIMKLSHHGLRRIDDKDAEDKNNKISNSATLLGYVKPKISFIVSVGGKTARSETGEQASSALKYYLAGEKSRKNASKYGFCYPVGYMEKHFTVVCKSGKATMYEKVYNSKKGKYIATKLSGFVELKIKYKKAKAKKYDSKIEKYYINPSTGTSVRDKLKKIKNGKTTHKYYFNVNGCMLKNKLKEIESGKTTYKYYFNANGCALQSAWRNIADGKNKYRYYFNKSGHAVTGKNKIGGIAYYFNKDGKLLTKKGGKPLKIK